jgi:hypothetical protein
MSGSLEAGGLREDLERLRSEFDGAFRAPAREEGASPGEGFLLNTIRDLTR